MNWSDIPGWWSDACAAFYRQCVEQAPPRAHFVEVGSWLGRSAASMTQALLDLGRDDILFDVVDTWEGTPVEGDGGYHQRLISNGGLSLREDFEHNLRATGGWPYLYEIRTGDSVDASGEYPDRSLDLVFIDGDHRAEMVERDCSAWLPKLRYGGILAGHDANAEHVIAGVRAAGIEPEIKGQLWWWRKRLPLLVQSTNPLVAGVLNGLAGYFGEYMRAWAVEEMPRYFDVGAVRPFAITDCGQPRRVDGEIVFCPCDYPHPATYLRSAHDGERPFPAFPHNGWPFLSRSWEPPPVKVEGIGFCGVARPEIRRRAIEAVKASRLPHRIIEREQFFGQDVPKEQARAEYLSTLLDYRFQLCVRGVGNYCYRLYETLAAGRIPIFIDTDRPLPWADRLPWDDMAVIVPEREIGKAHLGAWIDGWRQQNDLDAQGRLNRQFWWDYLSPVGWWREWARTQ